MPALPRLPACLALLPLVLPVLAGCGAKTDEKFAPPCPVPSIPRDSNDLLRYRGTGRDLTDNVLVGRITSNAGTCKADGPGFVKVTVKPGIELTRGPAATSRTADVAYYVAISQGERIIDKQVYRLQAEFPANTDRVRLEGDEVELRLPVSASKSAAVYTLSVGFQLTAVELQLNRQRISR